jgi:hypothetical protein
LEDAGLFEKGKCGGIKTNLWIDCLRNTDTAERIETNLGLTHGTFKKGRKEERRKKKEKYLLVVVENSPSCSHPP